MRDDAVGDEALLQRVMKRQAALSLKVAAVFVLLLLGLPLANLYLPRLGASNVGGFTLTWLFLGVLFYPITWVLSSVFVKNSNCIESELVAENTSSSLSSTSHLGNEEGAK
jgi:uncharacterized membrane protein (DUF485 family)